MRKSFVFLTFVAGCFLLLFGFFVTGQSRLGRFSGTVRDLQDIALTLTLTDMSFSTDARYTRHPSQADIFSAFQDYPCSIEHFPSGSVVPPPDFSALGTRITTRGR